MAGMYNIIHSMVILFTSMALGCGIQEIFGGNRSITRIREVQILTLFPGCVFSIANCGLEATVVAICIHTFLLNVK